MVQLPAICIVVLVRAKLTVPTHCESEHCAIYMFSLPLGSAGYTWPADSVPL